MKGEVIVVGGGVGGLVAAILLRAGGAPVRVFEASPAWGGKAGIAEVDGVEFDTGPSVLTLPESFAEVFRRAGVNFLDEVRLIRPEPFFHYVFPSGECLEVHHELEDTRASISRTFGESAARDFLRYLEDARQIWEAASPHFVLGEAPHFGSLIGGGWAKLRATTQIDAFRTLERAIEARVKSPELRMLLQRYATYNGSDVRHAPATLGCIAHVELGLGGYGIQGGLYELIRALVRLATRLGVELETDAPVERIELHRGRVSGLVLARGERVSASQIVVNADVAHLFESLLPEPARTRDDAEVPLSMSGYNAVYRVPRGRTSATRAAHTVLFPNDYLAEFREIFDERRPPREPTVYLCAQELAHGRRGWQEEEPLFVMANAPAVSRGDVTDPERAVDQGRELAERVHSRLVEQGWVTASDVPVWQRFPQDLAQRFPGSRGALYGPASNDKWAAFRRAPNAWKKIPGLYLASGSAHPGGGLPLVCESGKRAAEAVLRTRGDVR